MAAEEQSARTAELAASLAETVGTSFKAHPLRRAYEDEVRKLEKTAQELAARGRSSEAIARELHEARRQLGVRYKDATPEPLREYIYQLNMKRYGDPLGPSYDDLRALGKTDEEIVAGATRPSTDIDKLLGGFATWLTRQDPAKLAGWE